MQMLYQWELGGNTPEQVDATFFLERKVGEEVEAFARELFRGAVNDIETLDGLIRKHAENWRLERMAAVDRSVLRVAVYEFLHCPETPPPAVINEALEIARRFSGEGSVEFVNGVLDAIQKSLPASHPAPPQAQGL
jgi:N utilization substance protein B